jgi:hypothetical protein
MILRRLAPLTLLLTLVACDSTSPAMFSDVQVSFATQAAGQPLLSMQRATPPVLLDDTLVTGTDTIIFTEVSMVLREIELKPVEVASCDDSSSSGSGGSECKEFEAGPVLVSLPLDGSVQPQFRLDVPAGSYQEIELEIHKVSKDDPEDAAFRAQHPTFVEISIRARGTHNGSSFVFETDLDVEQELDFSPALVIEENVATNITILVGLDTWFVDGSGGLYDPQTGNKGGQNEGEIKENIKTSIEAFEDDDRDGGR